MIRRGDGLPGGTVRKTDELGAGGAAEPDVASSAGRSWRSLALTALAALGTIVLCDLALQRVQPLFPPVRHVQEGVDDLAASNPTTLVLGSSHARTFEAMRATVEARSGGRERLVTVPVEMGGFSSYRWVLEHRLAPLLDGRPALRNLMLVTTFYDACSVEATHGDLNIPARAWTLRDFLDDAWAHGLNDFNRNYVRERWKRLFPGSVLVQDRGASDIAGALKRLVRPEPVAAALESAREHLEAQHAWCQDERELASLAAIADFAAARGLSLTVVSFPLVPDIVSAKGRATTLAWYEHRLGALAAQKGFRVVDLTSSTPLVRDDFAADLDHVTATGNRKLADWVLARDLRWLVEP
jgi:hypothetical protein